MDTSESPEVGHDVPSPRRVQRGGWAREPTTQEGITPLR
jgi:hypothetical protein